MVPGAGACSRARPLPTGWTRRPTAPASSTTRRRPAPSKDGTATRSDESTTTPPLPVGRAIGATLGASRASLGPVSASGMTEVVSPPAWKAARTFFESVSGTRLFEAIRLFAGRSVGVAGAAGVSPAFCRSGSSAGRSLTLANRAERSAPLSSGTPSIRSRLDFSATTSFGDLRGMSWGTPRYSRTSWATCAKTGAETVPP